MSIQSKVLLITAAWILVFLPAAGMAHCQVPCGIYGDALRLDLMAEDIATIEKAMMQISDLSKAESPNYNQIVRWVQTKEDHAQKIQDTAAEYFLAQRIKVPATEDPAAVKIYQDQLSLLHKIIVAAMKAKQTTDPDPVADLKNLLKSFRASYLKEDAHAGH
ncbi:MAG TPA: superoxide dismutase [Ni] [Thermoanaerobaculia bacterium]|nr:superoxide dismutase [Ni] [Thermoanaerobaculia bacterium]HUM28816.1 superoxide dismutase [Ni] [Thermoanaerobaculia bacterium]HXK69073.1 superoxide dismutase [Ni] [Thermoanaerobaculia bacterium]